MLLLSFSSGCVLTLAPDLSVGGLENKGLFFACYTVTSLLIRLVAGKSSDKYGRVPVLIVSSIALVLAMIFLSASHSILMFMIAAAIFGLSWEFTAPLLLHGQLTCAGQIIGACRCYHVHCPRSRHWLRRFIVGNDLQNHSSRFVYAFIASAILALIACFIDKLE
jgi:hypothetical protein